MLLSVALIITSKYLDVFICVFKQYYYGVKVVRHGLGFLVIIWQGEANEVLYCNVLYFSKI